MNSGIDTLNNMSIHAETFHQIFPFQAQPFLLSDMNFVDRLELEVLNSECFDLIVKRFGITTWFCDALFSPLKRFGGSTVRFITIVIAVILVIALVTEGNACVAVDAGKLA